MAATSRLLSLPRELRDIVYDFTFYSDGNTKRFEGNDDNPNTRATLILMFSHVPQPAMFYVNRQINIEYAEATTKIMEKKPLHVEIETHVKWKSHLVQGDAGADACGSFVHDQLRFPQSLQLRRILDRTRTFNLHICVAYNRIQRRFWQQCESQFNWIAKANLKGRPGKLQFTLLNHTGALAYHEKKRWEDGFESYPAPAGPLSSSAWSWGFSSLTKQFVQGHGSNYRHTINSSIITEVSDSGKDEDEDKELVLRWGPRFG